MYNKINDELNSILENHKKELNSIIVKYILIKTIIFAAEAFEIVANIIQQGKEFKNDYK